MNIIINNVGAKNPPSFKKEIIKLREHMKKTSKEYNDHFQNYLNKLDEIEENLDANPDLFIGFIEKDLGKWLEKFNKDYILYQQLIEKELIPKGVIKFGDNSNQVIK